MRACLNCGCEIPKTARADAKFCCDTCRFKYDARAREIGRAELEKQGRANKNLATLKQVKDGALVKIKLEPTSAKPRWSSGYYVRVDGDDLVLRTREGLPLVFNLREVEVVLSIESRVDALAFGGV